MALYFKLFWFPAGVSAVLLAWCWREGQLSGRSGWTLVAWFTVAAALQGLVSSTAAWVVGLLLQTALAVTLLVRSRFEQL